MRNVFFIFLFVFFAGCSVYNVFSPANSTNIDEIYDSEVLISMGDKYFEEGDYALAYKAYSRAAMLSPNKSFALEGKARSYIFLKTSYTNLISSLQQNNFSNIGGLNKIYDISKVVALSLFAIINNSADGKISSSDLDVNFVFYIFNNFYSIYDFLDSDFDNNIENDTGDLLCINQNYEIDTTNSRIYISLKELEGTNANPFKLLAFSKMVKTLNLRYNSYKTNLSYSLKSLSNIYSSLSSEATSNLIMPVISNFTIVISNVDTAFTNLSYSGTNINTLNLTNIFDITNLIVFTNINITNNAMVTNYFMDAGYGPDDYNSFTNDLYNSGITNMSDITNIFPGLTNINQISSNYFNL
ncbi:MAG: tetratricopeptide repeat protein [Brevinematales bacterium]|nr:tetratricopeptide repeat protein [Brevinematales bacterium]